MRIHRVAPAASTLILVLLAASPTLAQDTAQELYQAGLYQEEVQGNLQRAIDLFGRILVAFPDNRAVGAKAQLHIGLCYEKLGQREARQAYRRVIADFPEHAAEVAVARDRLAEIDRSLAELNRQPTFRKIEIASKPRNGVLSPDGSRLAFLEDEALWLVPIEGDVAPDIAGEPIRIADVPGAWDQGSLMAWSADGRWIAVNGGGGTQEWNDVFLVPAAGGQPRSVRLPPRGGHAWNYRVSLSPHGNELAFSALELGTVEEFSIPHRYIYSMPTSGGDLRKLADQWGRLPSFSPDGSSVAFVSWDRVETAGEDEAFDGHLWVVPSDGGTPRKLATVAGRLRGPVWSPDGRYIAAHLEPGGNNASREVWVFSASPEGPDRPSPVRVPLPRFSWNMVAGWAPSGELGVFIVADEHRALYTVPASGGKAVQVSPEALPYYPRWSADGERVYFRHFQRGVGVPIAYVPALGGEIVELAVRSDRPLVSRVPGGGLNLSPDGTAMVVCAYQEPYDPEEGVDVWTIPLDGRPATQLTRDRSFEGWPSWSPDGRWIAFTESYEQAEDREEFLAIYRVPAAGGEQRRITSEADSVERGAIAFSPDGERIAFFSGGAIKTKPVDGGPTNVLVENVRAGEDSDLAWSPDGTRIAFNGGGKLWTASVGGEPQELRTGLVEGARHGTFDWSRDGEKIVFVAVVGGEPELWLIGDFLPKERVR